MELPRNLTGGVPAGVVDAALLAVESRKRLLLPARRDLSGVEGAGEEERMESSGTRNMFMDWIDG